MTEFLHDKHFWYGVAFFVFWVLALRYGKKPMLGFLDGEIAKVKSQLDEAQNIRLEAEALLKEYRAKEAAAMVEARHILDHAQLEAERIRVSATQDLKDRLKRQEQMVTDRINFLLHEAQAEIRARAVDLAVEIAKKSLVKEDGAQVMQKLTARAMASVPKLAKTKN